jgi:lipoate-protein ligase A
MEKIWRLIVDEARDPHMNMAIDEAIMLRQAGAGSVPTLRIYKWLYPCISIGRFQKPLRLPSPLRGEDKGEGDNSLPIVKRPTGGGAVAHNESGFTYSIIYREDSGVISRGVLSSYKEIHSGIIESLKGLGVKAEFHLSGDNGVRPAADKECFMSPVDFDVMRGGRKIAGAAQRRKCGVVLHQGEISLGLDDRLKWSYNDLLIEFTGGLSRHLKAKFLKSQVSDIEMNLAEGLMRRDMVLSQDEWK